MSVSSCTCSQEEESSFTVGNVVAPKKPLGILFSAASRGDTGPQQLSGYCSQKLGLNFLEELHC